MRSVGSTIWILAVIAMPLLGAGCLPEESTVERSIEIEAPLAHVFEQVNDLEKNAAWSPWAAADETMVTEYGSITRGLGATSSWTSENMGAGSLEITESIPHSLIRINLDFGEEGQAEGYWKFSEQNGTVTATWGMRQRSESFGQRVFGLMLDYFVGPYFEEGLASLKEVAEAGPPVE